jgi:hypothetical protein
MNYLFTFREYIDLHMLMDFTMFCWELNEIVCLTSSANDNDQGAEFPPNFIMVYVDTDNEEDLNTISHKYNSLINESHSITATELTLRQGRRQ